MSIHVIYRQYPIAMLRLPGSVMVPTVYTANALAPQICCDSAKITRTECLRTKPITFDKCLSLLDDVL